MVRRGVGKRQLHILDFDVDLVKQCAVSIIVSLVASTPVVVGALLQMTLQGVHPLIDACVCQ